MGARPTIQYCGIDPLMQSSQAEERQAPAAEPVVRKLAALTAGRYRGGRLMSVVLPLALTALATSILLLAVDFHDPASTSRAAMGVALLIAVFVRQATMIVDLDRTVHHRERQLAVMGEVVAALNTTSNVGSTLRAVLARIVTGLGADAGAVWLPDSADRKKMVLVEQIGLPDPERGAELLALVERAAHGQHASATTHRGTIPGQEASLPAAELMTVRIGRRAEDQGFLTVVKSSGSFDGPDQDLLSAIGSDIAGTLRSIRLIDAAHHLADRDPITELFNHRYAVQQLYREIERHQRAGITMTVLMLDLDNFKLFNDTYGHPAGDEVLRQVGGILRNSFRDTDTVARYGGDEFIVLLPETTLDQAVMCAKRFQDKLCRSTIAAGDSDKIPLFTCCGIASFPNDSEEVLELIAIADANLYAAKSQGKGFISTRALEAEDSFGDVEGFDLLRSLVIAVDNKDRYTRQHSEEVTQYALEIAEAMGHDPEYLRTIHISGLLHDLGKIGVPERVLKKPGKLTPDEIAVMNQHPVIGAMIVGSMPGMEEVVLGVRHHHERYDGKGYPDGLAGEKIPLIARIIAVGDVFSALTTHRPYRKAFSTAEALDIMEKGLGTQFDPEIGRVFIRLKRDEIREDCERPMPLLEREPAAVG